MCTVFLEECETEVAQMYVSLLAWECILFAKVMLCTKGLKQGAEAPRSKKHRGLSFVLEAVSGALFKLPVQLQIKNQ